MNVAIIGCGLIGNKRAAALQALNPYGHKLVSCYDAEYSAALSLAERYACSAVSRLEDVLEDGSIGAVIVATTHDVLSATSSAVAKHGKHVLVEKPGARTARELQLVIDAKESSKVYVAVGFNHRYHPAISKAWDLCDLGDIGTLLHVRACYGHGGRSGYGNEWRLNKERSGGGELLDQGTHLIDLAHRFLGDDLSLGYARLTSAFWDAGVEDNAFLVLEGAGCKTAQLHASWTEWRNRFVFEIFGSTGKLEINGLGGSYGVETLVHYRMDTKTMLPPAVASWQWLGSDDSWRLETLAWLTACENPLQRNRSLVDALHTLKLVDAAYAK